MLTFRCKTPLKNNWDLSLQLCKIRKFDKTAFSLNSILSKSFLSTTFRDLSTVQKYLNNLFSRGELIREQKKEMRPKFPHIGRAYGLPKIYKQFDRIPSFQLIVKTTNTPDYGSGKFLVKLLNPLSSHRTNIQLRILLGQFIKFIKFRLNYLIKVIDIFGLMWSVE